MINWLFTIKPVKVLNFTLVLVCLLNIYVFFVHMTDYALLFLTLSTTIALIIFRKSMLEDYSILTDVSDV